MPAGRPLKFPSPEAMQAKIDAYFTACEVSEKTYTITGLALALDTNRETLCNYEERDEFFDTIKRAKMRVEEFYEGRLVHPGPTGSIFALKNFGWKDNQTVSGDPLNPIKHEHSLAVRFIPSGEDAG